MKLTGNTILITGGGSGIGRGLAEAFHQLKHFHSYCDTPGLSSMQLFLTEKLRRVSRMYLHPL